MIVLKGVDEDALHQLAQDIAIASNSSDCFALHGDLGAGKTSFARAFIRHLAGDDIEVPSPTFTLVQHYETHPHWVSHFDLYRITDEDEVLELGLDETREGGVCLIEWPEKAGGHLPSDSIQIRIATNEKKPDARDVNIEGATEAMQQSLAVRSFLTDHGFATASRKPFTGDASTRRYETVDSGQGRRVLMIAPRQPDGPPVRDGKPYSQLAHLAEDIAPFIVIGTEMRAKGFRAPSMDAFDVEQGFLLLEDLGAGSVLDASGHPVEARYRDAVTCLAALHDMPWKPSLQGRGLDHHLSAYDADVFLMEASLLLDWYAPEELGHVLTEEQRDAFTEIMTALWEQLDPSRFTILLRDYHSPNIIYDETKSGTDRIGLIDFQDALWGPAAYDVMSLVHDARVTVPAEMGENLLDSYVSARRDTAPAFDPASFRAEAAICTAQRLCKILGIFHRLNARDGKPAYLAHLPRVRTYLETVLRDETLAPLANWWRETGLGETAQ